MNKKITLLKSELSQLSLFVKAGEVYKIILSGERRVEYIEVPDIVFNLNSAIPCIDDDKYLVRTLLTAQLFSAQFPEKELVIFGHADTSGEISLNYSLSELRAKAVWSIINNDKDAWKSIADEKSCTRDYQTILNVLDKSYGWGCNCGQTDNIHGSKTEAALKNFQKKVNEKYHTNIQVDGKIGPETWGAFHTVYTEIIRAQHQNPECCSKITTGFASGNGVYGCGESFPVDEKERDNYQSKLNRRVELVFFMPGMSNQLKLPPDNTKCLLPAECFPYDSENCQKEPIPLSQCGGEFGGEDWVEIQLNDKQGNPVPGERYIIFADEGTKVSGVLNDNGYAKIEKLFNGDYFVIFPDVDNQDVSTDSVVAVYEE